MSVDEFLPFIMRWPLQMSDVHGQMPLYANLGECCERRFIHFVNFNKIRVLHCPQLNWERQTSNCIGESPVPHSLFVPSSLPGYIATHESCDMTTVHFKVTGPKLGLPTGRLCPERNPTLTPNQSSPLHIDNLIGPKL